MSTLAGLAALAVGLLGACKPSGDQGDQTPDIPSDLSGLMSWASERLLTPRELTPIPTPRDRHEPRGSSGTGPVICLRSLWDGAELHSDWSKPALPTEPILTIHDRSIDRPGPSADSRVSEMRPGRFYRCLVFDPLQLDGTRVGRIEIRGNFGQAKELHLAWSRAGKLALPLPHAADGAAALVVSTEMLSDWDQELGWFTLSVPAHAENDIRLESLSFLPRESAFPEPVGQGKLMLSRHLRPVIYAHDVSDLAFPHLMVPVGARFETGLAVTGAEGGRIRIAIRDGAQEQVLFDQQIGQMEQWIEFQADLSQWGRRTADLIFSTSALGAGVAFWANPQIVVPVEDPPRVLVYLVDTLGAKHMSLYGYERDTTPRMAELASRGTWFANAFANATRTVESVPNMMLSMPTVSHGVQDDFDRVASGFELLAEDFRRAGYATACFSTNVNAGPRQNLDRGFEDFFDRFAYHWSEDASRTVPIEDVTAWMERKRDRPVFVYVHTAEPHSPYNAPPPFGDRFDPDYAGSITGSHTDEENGFQAAQSPRDIEHVIALYDGEVAFADHRFGQFVDRLRESSLDEGLITVVTSDHGEEFLEHGNWKHGLDVYNELLRVPLIITGPEDMVPRRKVSVPVQLLDIRPTLLDLCGIQASGKVYGDSLVRLLQEQDVAKLRERPILASTYQPFPPHHALIQWPWKLIFAPGGSPSGAAFRLFNLEDDPEEKRDLLRAEPDVAKELIRKLIREGDDYPRYKTSPDVMQFDRDQIERLKDLGYLRGTD